VLKSQHVVHQVQQCSVSALGLGPRIVGQSLAIWPRGPSLAIASLPAATLVFRTGALAPPLARHSQNLAGLIGNSLRDFVLPSYRAAVARQPLPLLPGRCGQSCPEVRFTLCRVAGAVLGLVTRGSRAPTPEVPLYRTQFAGPHYSATSAAILTTQHHRIHMRLASALALIAAPLASFVHNHVTTAP
jgi:hypothetical protein